MHRIFLRPADLLILNDWTSTRTATKEMRYLRDCLNKTKDQKITIKEYATHYGINEKDVYEALNIKV